MRKGLRGRLARSALYGDDVKVRKCFWSHDILQPHRDGIGD
jgi:hypothetical protein